MKENLKDLIGTKVVIHCNEEGQARRLIEKLRELDYEWVLRDDKTYWGIYGKRTGYFLDAGFGLQHGYLTEEGLQHGEMEIEKERFRIVEFDNLADFEEIIKPIKLKIVGIEEGKRFRFKGNNANYMLKDGIVMVETHDGGWSKSYVTANRLADGIIPINDIILTDNERKILEGRLAEGYKWMAKDKNGAVFFFGRKPVVESDRAWHAGPYSASCYEFDFLSWEDEEPTNIEELLRDE